MFSVLQNLSAWSEQKQVKLEEARRHLRFCMKLYRRQVEEGRLFLHEHPSTVTSWPLKEVQEVLGLPGVSVVIGDQVHVRLKDEERQGQAGGICEEADEVYEQLVVYLPGTSDQVRWQSQAPAPCRGTSCEGSGISTGAL